MSLSNREIVEAVIRLHANHDLDRIVSHFAEDVVYEDVPVEKRVLGHAGVKELYGEVYTQFPDHAMKLVSVMVDGDRGGAEFVQTGTHLGEGFDFPVTGKAITIRTAAMIRFSGWLVTRWSDYWSLSAFKKQVGLE